MSDTQNSGLQYLMIIAEQKKKKKFQALLYEHGAHGIETIYGYGSTSPRTFAAAFGFDARQGKVLISCLVKTDDARDLINILYNEYKFNKPNTGIAFTVPVEGLSF